ASCERTMRPKRSTTAWLSEAIWRTLLVSHSTASNAAAIYTERKPIATDCAMGPGGGAGGGPTGTALGLICGRSGWAFMGSTGETQGCEAAKEALPLACGVRAWPCAGACAGAALEAAAGKLPAAPGPSTNTRKGAASVRRIKLVLRPTSCPMVSRERRVV